MDQATIVGVSVALCNFIAYLVASTMGLFGGNKFPVEGKVSCVEELKAKCGVVADERFTDCTLDRRISRNGIDRRKASRS